MHKTSALSTTAPLELTQTIKNDELPADAVSNPLNISTVDENEKTQTTQFSADEHPNLPQIAVIGEHQGQPRYRFGELLGKGGGGFVYEVNDLNLKRSIALKVTPKSKKDKSIEHKVIREASLTSILEHPNIPPVYDIGLDSDGRIFYSMKKIEGKPLSSFIPKDDTDTAPRLELKKIVSIFTQACLAASYAHHHKIIHRDIKPDNIMIGEHDEVYLVDWGIAIHKDRDEIKDKLAGTPIYMSPEQSRREIADERSDIYCIGTTLYHTLFNRMPVEFVDTDTFWEYKKNGIIPTPNTTHIPPDLAAICFKCLKVEPQNRYQNMSEIISDLKAFELGNMVSVYKYSLFEALSFHLKKSSKHFTWILIAIIVTSVALYNIYRYYKLSLTSWGDPIFIETYDHPSASEDNWINLSRSGRLEVREGKLTTRDADEFVWFYKQQLNGSVAIEFEGKIPKNSKPGDLSIVYSPEITFLDNGNYFDNFYYLQHGAVNNSCSIIELKGSRLDYKRMQLEKNVTYKIRGEIDGKKLRLYLNDELICSYNLLFPLNKGYIGLYSYYEGKVFDNIKVYNKELPQLASITATGDLLYDKGQYELAERRYLKISQDYQETEIGTESLYKIGLCNIQLGKTKKAFEVWSQITDPKYQNQINHYKWKDLFDKGQYKKLAQEISHFISKTEDKEQIKYEWASYLDQICEMGRIDVVDDFLDIRERHFPDDQIYSNQVFSALKLKGETNRALVMFPEHDRMAIQALLESGSYNDIIQNYPHQHSYVKTALYRSGQFDYIIKHYQHDEDHYLLMSLIATGQLKQAMQTFANNQDAINQILINGYGDLESLLKQNPDDEWAHNTALYHSGALKEFIETVNPNLKHYETSLFDARLAIVLNNYFKGTNKQKVFELCQSISGTVRSRNSQLFSVHFLTPTLEYLSGNRSPLKQHITYIKDNLKYLQGRRTWFCARLLDGKIGKNEFMTQPNKLFVEYDFYIFTALRHDLRGRNGLAVQYYQKAQALPRHKHYTNFTLQAFIRNRITKLKQP